jgi:hypothetical protein
MSRLIIIFLLISISIRAQVNNESGANQLSFNPTYFTPQLQPFHGTSGKFKLLSTDIVLEGQSSPKSLIFSGNQIVGFSDTRILLFDTQFQNKGSNLQSDQPEIKPSLITEKDNTSIESSLGVNYALFIANADYQFNTAGLGDLDKPIIDAQSLKEVLTNKYQFQEENITFLQNADKSQTLQSVEAIARKISNKDNLLIFYAGHGHWDEFLKLGYWLPSDANFNNKSTWISNSTIKDYINAIPSKHTLLITDACFSGSIMKTRSANSVNAYAVSKLYKLPSRKAMTSGTLTIVPDESVFMKYLIKRLQENELAYLPVSQLFYDMRNAILNNSVTVPQYGTIQSTGDEGGEFIFIKK